MRNCLSIFALIAMACPTQADDAAATLEKLLHGGKLAEAEQAVQQIVSAAPNDAQAHFALGVAQFLRAVENLGQAMYEYGAVSENASEMFLRLPVPQNPQPSAISYRSLGRVLEVMLADLARAEATLAMVTDDDVELPLRLAGITFDFTGTGENTTSLVSVLQRLNDNTRPGFLQGNDEFLVHFDRGDVAWLRGYCNLLSAVIEGYRAVDESAGFTQRVSRVFPRVESSEDPPRERWWEDGLAITDPVRMGRLRQHLVAVCRLNEETWAHIRAETDDNHEWLPHPGQTDMLGMPLDDNRILIWLATMKHLEELLTGERLVPSALLQFISRNNQPNMGLNLAKLLDNPPRDLLNLKRLSTEGVSDAFLESETDREVMNVAVIFRVSQVFSGPFGVFQAARLN